MCTYAYCAHILNIEQQLVKRGTSVCYIVVVVVVVVVVIVVVIVVFVVVVVVVIVFVVGAFVCVGVVVGVDVGIGAVFISQSCTNCEQSKLRPGKEMQVTASANRYKQKIK